MKGEWKGNGGKDMENDEIDKLIHGEDIAVFIKAQRLQ